MKEPKFRRISVYTQFILVLIIFATLAHGAGEVDTSFNPYLSKLAGGASVFRSAVQPDGKIVITGNFVMIQGKYRPMIARLNTDGSIDESFQAPVSITAQSQPIIQAIGIQSDGKIVIGGSFIQFDDTIRQGIARLNSDGSLDTAFNSIPSLNNVQLVYHIKIYPDDKIIFSGLRSGGFQTITRLNADGSFNAEGNFPAFRFDLNTDGKIIFHDHVVNGLRRLNENLTLDNTYSQVSVNQTIYAVVAQPDGKTIIGGFFTTINGTPSPGLARINSNGSADVPFIANSSGGGIWAVQYRPDGKILVGGGGGIVLRNPDGSIDAAFNSGITFGVLDLDFQNGNVIVSGASDTNDFARSAVIRLTLSGTPDPSFLAAVGGLGKGSRIIVLPDDKILVGGNFDYAAGIARKSLVKFNADGTVDTSFDANQNAFASLGSFDVFPDGKIIVLNGFTLTRLNADGSNDFVFPNAVSGVNSVKALPDGKILVARNNNLERYNSNGTIDTLFNVPVTGTILSIALQSDGKIMIGGNFTQVNGTDRSKIARLNSDGTLDAVFNSPTGGINGSVTRVALSPGGKTVIGGTFSGISFENRQGLARLNADGGLDNAFVPPTTFSLDTLKVQPDGKVLLGKAGALPVAQRLNADGSIDGSFNVIPVSGDTFSPRVRGIDLQSDGKIIFVGEFLHVNGAVAPGIVRLRSTSKVLFDYDGDGRSDISVFRPATNRWYEILSSNSSIVEKTFGSSGDVVAPADYDGDGKTDLGIFRPSSGDWWYLSSVNNAQVQVHWGQAGDIPRPSDFDGDGKSDFVIFRPSENNWYRFGSTGAVSIVNFGSTGDKPVVGDFDGDGKSDVAIFRPSTGDWWYKSSVNGALRASRWGISSDVPTPADFDGDGKTDFAVYRASTGIWYIANSSNSSFTIINFGISEDKPVAADFDGDGKADIAVFRPSTGVWYLLKSTEGFGAIQFGVSTDVPIPNSFVP